MNTAFLIKTIQKYTTKTIIPSIFASILAHSMFMPASLQATEKNNNNAMHNQISISPLSKYNTYKSCNSRIKDKYGTQTISTTPVQITSISQAFFTDEIYTETIENQHTTSYDRNYASGQNLLVRDSSYSDFFRIRDNNADSMGITMYNTTIGGKFYYGGDTPTVKIKLFSSSFNSITIRTGKDGTVLLDGIESSGEALVQAGSYNILIGKLNTLNVDIKNSTFGDLDISFTYATGAFTISNTTVNTFYLISTFQLNNPTLNVNTAFLSRISAKEIYIKQFKTITLSESTVKSITLLYADGTIFSDFNIDNSLITNDIITSENVNTSISLTNSTIGGNLNVTQGGTSTISVIDSTITNTITTGSGNDSLSLSNSTVGGPIDLGEGHNTLELETMTLEDISLLQGSNTISINNSTIKKAVTTASGDDNITLTDSNAKNLTGGAGNNTISIERSQLDALILNEGQNTVHVNGATIRGALGTVGNNTISLSESYIGGNISASEFTLTNGLYFQNTVGSGTINRTINAPNITMNDGFIYTNPNTPGDVLYIEGNVSTTATKSPSFILDTDMSAGITDRVHFDGVVTAPDNTLLFSINNVRSISRATGSVNSIENVITFTNNTNITLPKVYIGGSEYSFVEGATPNSWDLLKVGASKYNDAFSSMQYSNKQYTSMVWDTISKRIYNGLLEYAMEKPPIPKKVVKKVRIKGKIYNKTTTQWPRNNTKDKITVWANGQGGFSTFKASGKLSSNAILGMGMFGVDIKKLDIKNLLRFNIHIFGAYGVETSKLTAPTGDMIKIDGNMNVFSLGTFATMETLKSFMYKYFIRVGLWADLFQNSLQYNDPTRIQNKDAWGAFAINTSVAGGIRFNIRNFTIVPEIGILYSYIKGNEFTSSDSALVTFQEEHLLVAKATVLAGYNTKIGIKPYMRVGVEMPFSVAGGGVYVGDNATKYRYTDKLIGLTGVGMNYSIQIKGLDISTYIDVTSNIGASTLDVIGNIGISVGF